MNRCRTCGLVSQTRRKPPSKLRNSPPFLLSMAETTAFLPTTDELLTCNENKSEPGLKTNLPEQKNC